MSSNQLKILFELNCCHFGINVIYNIHTIKLAPLPTDDLSGPYSAEPTGRGCWRSRQPERNSRRLFGHLHDGAAGADILVGLQR